MLSEERIMEIAECCPVWYAIPQGREKALLTKFARAIENERAERIKELSFDAAMADQAREIGNHFGLTYMQVWSDTSIASQVIDKMKEQQAAIAQQAEENARLKGVIEKCKEALEDSHQNINQERGFASEIKRDIEQALAAIKEEGL